MSRTRLVGRSDPINSVAFSLDAQTLAIAGWDQKIRVWDVNSGSEKLMINTCSCHCTGVQAGWKDAGQRE